MSFMGVLIQTAIYAYTWIEVYHMKLAWHNKFTFKGHVLMIFEYFVLLLFFSMTYGGLKIGYLKPWDVYFSKVFALVCVGFISYFQISLMEVRLVRWKPLVAMVVFQIAIAGIWTFLCNRCYKVFFPPRKLNAKKTANVCIVNGIAVGIDMYEQTAIITANNAI